MIMKMISVLMKYQVRKILYKGRKNLISGEGHLFEQIIVGTDWCYTQL